MPHRRHPSKKTPTSRLILELRAISVSYRSFAYRKRVAEEADRIPKTNAEVRGNRMGDVAASARALLRRFVEVEELETLRSMAVDAVQIADALNTRPGQPWEVTKVRPQHAA